MSAHLSMMQRIDAARRRAREVYLDRKKRRAVILSTRVEWVYNAETGRYRRVELKRQIRTGT